MTIRKKQRLFIDAHTDRSSPETYDNATKSAIKAGYAEVSASQTGHHLLKREDIKQEIIKINLEYNIRFADTLENKIKIAWDNYIKFTQENRYQLATRWYEEHGKLSGHYVQRVDFKDTTKRSKEEIEELKKINNRVFDISHLVSSN